MFPSLHNMRYFEENNTKFGLGVISVLPLELSFSTSARLTQLFCLGLCEDHLVLCTTLRSTDPPLTSSGQHTQPSDLPKMLHQGAVITKWGPSAPANRSKPWCNPLWGCLFVFETASSISQADPELLKLLPPSMLRLQPCTSMDTSQVHVR